MGLDSRQVSSEPVAPFNAESRKCKVNSLEIKASLVSKKKILTQQTSNAGLHCI
jgi:hypothetical protein